jgi:ABC-type lipoprotein release transport system permease subunit
MRFLPLGYSLKNVIARPTRSAVTVGVIALVVVAASLFLGLVSSIKRTLVESGDPLNVVVLRKGADNDGSSQLPREALMAVRFFDGVARDERDRPLVSPQLVVQPFFHTIEGGRENVLVRGVDEAALAVHDKVRIGEGRMLRPSSGEVVIGRDVVGRYRGATLGSEMEFGRGRWKVVGIMDADGASFESEVWVDVRELANDAKRTWPYSGFRVRARDAAAIGPLARRIDDDPRWAMEAKPEMEYYRSQASSADALYFLVVGIAVLAGLGAGFGAANTMYASVQARIGEIGTLRAIGFSRAAILTSFQVEALALALGGFVVGALGAMGLAKLLALVLGDIGFAAATFTTNVIELAVTPRDLVGALVLSLTIGLGGGFGPAWRAAHMRPIDALRRG